MKAYKITTSGNEKIIILCNNCGYKITDWKNIFAGIETSYICPRCKYEGYAYALNTKIIKNKKLVKGGQKND